MKAIKVYETFDGERHDTKAHALAYLDGKYAELLCKIGHNLVLQEKYGAMKTWVDAHLDWFTELARIKADMSCDPQDD